MLSIIVEREVQQAAEIEKYQRDLESSRIQCLQQQTQLNALQVCITCTV